MADNLDKLKKDLISQFNKDFPDSPLEQMNESAMAEVPGWMTTGNYALNWIVSKDMNKGLPMGRVILFTGDPGSGKSMVALSMMREPSIDLIVYMDSEGGGVTSDFADFLGIDASKILYTPIDTVEDLIGRMEKVIDIIEKNKSTKNVLMVIDSISMISTEREKDPKGGADMGAKAKLTRQFFRTYARKMQKLNIACVMTAHLTENIGGYGPSKTVAGGTIMGYMPSIEVRFTRVNAETELEQSAVGASLVKIRAEIIKSRFGTYGKRVKFDLDMEKGLDEYAGLGDILKDYGFMIPASADVEKQIAEKNIPKKSSGWWMFKPWGNPVTMELYQEMQDKGLSTSGKFREKQIKEFVRDNDWFKAKVAYLLTSIYDKNLAAESEVVHNAQQFLAEDNAKPIIGDTSELPDESIDEPVKESKSAPKKKTRKTTKKDEDVKVTKVQ